MPSTIYATFSAPGCALDGLVLPLCCGQLTPGPNAADPTDDTYRWTYTQAVTCGTATQLVVSLDCWGFLDQHLTFAITLSHGGINCAWTFSSGPTFTYSCNPFSATWQGTTLSSNCSCCGSNTITITMTL